MFVSRPGPVPKVGVSTRYGSCHDVFIHRQVFLITNNYVRQKILPSPWACFFFVVAKLACLNDPKSYAGGDPVPGEFSRTGLVEGQRPDNRVGR